MSFVVGQFTATWNALAVGQTADGFKLNWKFFKRLITGDNFAQTPQDGIHQGAEMFIGFTCVAYDAAGVQTMMWPYSATRWDMGVIGRTDVGSTLAKTLLLTAVAGTPAAALPATQTFTNAILAEGFPVEILFAPDLREVPLRMRIYPSNSGVFSTQT
jgi:hypothetical protein